MLDQFNISVIIPTFNRRQLLGRAIESVLKQTYSPMEIIVIDDGSNDGTRELIKNKYPEVKYIYQDNSGISSTRNLGINKSTGNWIAFLDSDDEWLPGKLQSQIEALIQNPEFKICHTNEIWIRNGRRVNPKKKHQKFGGKIFKKCLPLCVISPSSVLIHKSVFHEFGYFDTNLPACEDYDMWLRICAFLPVLYIPDELIIKYGGHDDQLSHKYWGMDRFRIQALDKIVNNPKINKNQRAAAKDMLVHKLEIFMTGAKKRKRTEIELSALLNKYQNYLD